MKTVIITLGIFLSVGTTAFAGNGESLVDRIMNRKISYPEALKAKGIETTVKVKVRVISENQLEIISIASDNNEMTQAVKQQIQNLKVNLPTNLIGQEFSYAFKFEIQK